MLRGQIWAEIYRGMPRPPLLRRPAAAARQPVWGTSQEIKNMAPSLNLNFFCMHLPCKRPARMCVQQRWASQIWTHITSHGNKGSQCSLPLGLDHFMLCVPMQPYAGS